jgi:hypothetical protein
MTRQEEEEETKKKRRRSFALFQKMIGTQKLDGSSYSPYNRKSWHAWKVDYCSGPSKQSLGTGSKSFEKQLGFQCNGHTPRMPASISFQQGKSHFFTKVKQK